MKMGNDITKKYKLTLAVGKATGAFVTGLAVGYQKRILVRPCKQEKEAMDDSSHQYLLG